MGLGINGNNSDQGHVITVASFTSVPEAELARGLLASCGIKATLTNAATVNIQWGLSNALGGVGLQVLAANAEQAAKILAERPAQVLEDEGWGACVKCGSKSLEVRLNKRATMWTWILLGLPLLRPSYSFRCRVCGSEMAETKTETNDVGID